MNKKKIDEGVGEGEGVNRGCTTMAMGVQSTIHRSTFFGAGNGLS